MAKIIPTQITELKNGYRSRLIELRSERDRLLPAFSLDGLVALTRRHKNLINDIVASLLEPYLPIFKDRSVGVFWNGSFSRNSNRLSSDYDLNFVYPEASRDELYPIEDQICSALAEIVDKPRDYVHGAVICHVHPLKDPGNLQGLERLMFKVRWGNHEPEQLKNYLISCVTQDLCYYWSATYETVYGRELLGPIFAAIERYEMDNAGSPEFLAGFDRLVASHKKFMSDHLKKLPYINLNEVKNIKENYKHHPFAEAFVILALIRRKLLAKKTDVGRIVLDDYLNNPQIKKLLGQELSQKLFQAIFRYIWVIVRLEAIFEKKTIRFGVHSKESVDVSFNKLYNDLCPEVTADFHAYHLAELKQLYNVLDEILQKL